MILSRTSQYAIQALIFVATRPRGEPVLNRTMAERLRVPPAYLAKILQQLCRGGLLQSARGRQGGFFLGEGREKADLMSVVALIEGDGFVEECVLGLKVCEDRTACPLHFKWRPVRERMVAILKEQTLENLAQAVASGRYRISDVPQVLVGDKDSDASRPAAA